MRSSYLRPPSLTDDRGRIRRVGVEIELGGLDIAEAAGLLIHFYGGQIERINRFGARVVGTRLGEFRVELDSMLLKQERYRSVLEKLNVGSEGVDKVEDALESLAMKFVPCEIAAPPLLLTRLHELDPLRDALHRRGAKGTRASFLYAFGLQLNPEVPSRRAASLKRHLQSFLLLYDWLVAVMKIDLTRKLAPFIDPFPEEYRLKLLAPDYEPDLDGLIDDYLEHNPTRNRPLDMMPLFAMLREAKVMAAAKEPEQIKKRPTFHYRLPNCEIDDPEWSFATEWNRWVEVERLAADPARLRALSDAYLQNTAKVPLFRERWADEVSRWLHPEDVRSSA